MKDATLSGKPVMGSARRMQVHGKLLPMEGDSLIGRWRALAAEGRKSANLSDDPQNRMGWADANPNYAMSVAMTAAALAILLGNFAFLP